MLNITLYNIDIAMILRILLHILIFILYWTQSVLSVLSENQNMSKTEKSIYSVCSDTSLCHYITQCVSLILISVNCK